MDAALEVNLERYAESALIRFLISDLSSDKHFVMLVRGWHTLFRPPEYEEPCKLIVSILQEYKLYTDWVTEDKAWRALPPDQCPPPPTLPRRIFRGVTPDIGNSSHPLTGTA